jgi:hypothetical protein
MYRVDTWKFIVKGLELLALPIRVRGRLVNKQCNCHWVPEIEEYSSAVVVKCEFHSFNNFMEHFLF